MCVNPPPLSAQKACQVLTWDDVPVPVLGFVDGVPGGFEREVALRDGRPDLLVLIVQQVFLVLWWARG